MAQIFEFQFKFKPDADEAELMRLFEELSAPVYRQIPGCIATYLIKDTAKTLSGGEPEWDYVAFEVWESDAAHRQALGKYIGFGDTQLAQTGFYERLMALVEKSQSSIGTIIASTK